MRAPLLPPGTFRDRTFTRAVLVAAVPTATTTPVMLLSILEQERELGRSPTEIGLPCLPVNLAVIAGSLLAGRLRVSPRAVMAVGLAGVACGALLMIVVLLPAYVVMGLSLGAASVAPTASGTEALGEHAGLASGLLNAAAQLGPALGLALVGVAGGYAFAAALALAAGLVVGPTRRRSRAAPQPSGRWPRRRASNPHVRRVTPREPHSHHFRAEPPRRPSALRRRSS